MDAQANTSSRFTNHGAALQRIIDTLDAVILHAYKVAGTELRTRCTCIE